MEILLKNIMFNRRKIPKNSPSTFSPKFHKWKLQYKIALINNQIPVLFWENERSKKVDIMF